MGKGVHFVTNNSTLTRVNYMNKFAQLGIPVASNEVISTSFCTAEFLRSSTRGSGRATAPGPKSKCFVIGAPGLCEEIRGAGINVISARDLPAAHPEMTMTQVQEDVVDAAVDTVVVGLDLSINYRSLAYAMACLNSNPGCRFVATNTDAAFPAEVRKVPGNGALVAALARAVGREPDVIIGKPSDVILGVLKNASGLDPASSLMVGDRLDTDIEFGNRGGMGTCLVLSGVTSEEDLKALAPGDSRVPGFIAKDIAELVAALN
jgi:phosphoglycolate/pyridoxal phosphate phosphatase family enzyme